MPPGAFVSKASRFNLFDPNFQTLLFNSLVHTETFFRTHVKINDSNKQLIQSKKMKVFELIRESFTNVGIRSDQINQRSVFNVKNTIFLFILWMSFISSLLYLLIEADNFEEYVNTFFICSGSGVVIILYANMIWQTSKIHEFSKSIEDAIKKRK